MRLKPGDRVALIRPLQLPRRTLPKGLHGTVMTVMTPKVYVFWDSGARTGLLEWVNKGGWAGLLRLVSRPKRESAAPKSRRP